MEIATIEERVRPESILPTLVETIATALMLPYVALWLLIRDGDQADKTGLIWVMWLIVPLALGIMLTLNGLNSLPALVWGNVYHLFGTAVGFIVAWFWKPDCQYLKMVHLNFRWKK
jgi:hypothetical protein